MLDRRGWTAIGLAVSIVIVAAACSSSGSGDGPTAAASTGGSPSAGASGSGASGASGSSAGGASNAGGSGGGGAATSLGGASTAGASAAGGSPGGGSPGAGMGGSSDLDGGIVPDPDAGAPPGFWDTKDPIPTAKNVMTFVFLNRTNGKYQDAEVYWSFKTGAIDELHSIADQPTYDMPANNSGRMYFYLCQAGDAACTADPRKSDYYDFIEHTIGAAQYNGNTTRVDAFGLKIAMRLRAADGFDAAVGEDYLTFHEDRAVTFQKFIDSVPDEFRPLAQPPHAPFRIVQPGAAGFDKGGANAGYYDSFVDTLWAANGLTLPKPGPNGSGLGQNPDVSAAIYRHVGAVAGTFDPAGKLLNKKLWDDPTTFYSAAPADYYAEFWHAHALSGKAYGFPYDDVGGYSSYISHKDPQSMVVAIGW